MSKENKRIQEEILPPHPYERLQDVDPKFYNAHILPLNRRLKATLPADQYEMVKKAYKYAELWHSGVKRDSGEPYIIHPLSVAEIVVNDLGLDYESICAALLHDVLEDTQASRKEMVKIFGQSIIDMVLGLTKIKHTDYHGTDLNVKDINQAENIRKLLLATAGDIRVVMIKLADRLHNMRTLDSLSHERQQRIANETLVFFAPLAERLGIMQIKGELEDLSFKYLFSEEYIKIKRMADEKYKSLNSALKKTEHKLETALKKQNIVFTISSRRKHYYSIYKKMKKQNCSFDEIYDFIAIRVITSLSPQEKVEVDPEALKASFLICEAEQRAEKAVKNGVAKRDVENRIIITKEMIQNAQLVKCAQNGEPVSEQITKTMKADALIVEEYEKITGETLSERKAKDEDPKLIIDKDIRAIAKKIEKANLEEERKRTIKCYEVVGIIHSMWTPLPGRIKDYISTPKPNMYQSFHTTVLSDNGNPVEIQVRTELMHRVAEYGVASHWKYKDGYTNPLFDKKLEAFRKTVEEEKEDKPAELIDALKQNLFAEDLFVFTPNGKVIHLPVNSTVIDFAYAIHTEVGNTLSGALVNDKFVPITTILKNSDIVKVQTQGKHPSIDWLRYVKSSGARSKIKQYFKKANREDHIRHGKELLDAEAKRRRYQLKDLITEERINEILEKYSLTQEDDLYAAIGNGDLKAENVLNFFINRFVEQLKAEKPAQQTVTAPKNESGILINGEANLLVRRAKCCKPLPGDNIVGYISRGRGITVHRADCREILSSEPDRFIKAEWGAKQTGSFSADLVITAHDRVGLTGDILTKIYAAKDVIFTEINAKVENQEATVFITVSVPSLAALSEVRKELTQIKGVRSVERAGV